MPDSARIIPALAVGLFPLVQMSALNLLPVCIRLVPPSIQPARSVTRSCPWDCSLFAIFKSNPWPADTNGQTRANLQLQICPGRLLHRFPEFHIAPYSPQKLQTHSAGDRPFTAKTGIAPQSMH